MKWPVAKLRSVATIDRRSESPAALKDDTPYLGLEHINGDGDCNQCEMVGTAQLKSSKFLFTDRHVLYGKLRPYLRKIARPSYSGVCSTDIIPLLPGDKLNKDYLFHFLRTPGMVSTATSLASGANLPRLSPNQLAEFEIPLPPLSEQKRIAAILDAAGALRAKRRESIAQLDTLLQATFLDMFGDPVKSGWPMRQVADFALPIKGSIRTGPFGSQLLHSEFVSAGIKVLGIDNVVANEFHSGKPRFITPEKFRQLERYAVKPGDVLISIMGTCGRCAVVPEDIGTAINTKHLCCISLDLARCQPTFLHRYFLTHPVAHEYLKSKSKGAIMDGLNMAIIKDLPVPAVPISLQQDFARVVDRVSQQKSLAIRGLEEIESLLSSLQSRAFSGQL